MLFSDYLTKVYPRLSSCLQEVCAPNNGHSPESGEEDRGPLASDFQLDRDVKGIHVRQKPLGPAAMFGRLGYFLFTMGLSGCNPSIGRKASLYDAVAMASGPS